MKNLKPKKFEILILAVIVIALLVWLLLPRSTGKTVQVTIDGEAAGTYSLLQEQRTTVEGYAGYHLELVIEGGKAHVENASCPDLICQNHAAIQSAGQEIVCLPARVVIEVLKDEAAGSEKQEKSEEEDTIDAVVG